MRNFPQTEIDPIMVSAEIEQIVLANSKVLRKQKSPYMQATLEYCEKKRLEFDFLAKMLNETIKHKLRLEAEDLHYLPKISRLPV